MHTLKTGLIVLIAAAVSSSAFAEWGDLKIKFKLTRKMSKEHAMALDEHKDCKGNAVFDPYATGPNLEVPNVMVWLEIADAHKVRVHPALAEKTATETPTIKIEGCQFRPHCFFATAGQTFVVTNEDAFGHAPHLSLQVNRSISPIIPATKTFEKKVAKAEKRPTPIACNIHPFMVGYVMVAPTPYHTVSDVDGTVTIKDLPVGKWEFKFWHEVHGNIAKVVRGGKPETWTKGVAAISIAKGENDLGEIQIVPKA